MHIKGQLLKTIKHPLNAVNNGRVILMTKLFCSWSFKRDFSSQVSSRRYRIAFFGTDNFAVQSLKALSNAKDVCSHLELVCPTDKATGRGLQRINQAPTKVYAINKGLRIHECPRDTLKGWKPNFETPIDIAVVVSFGYFLPSSLLSQFSLGGINVHPSLLPRHRGPSPIPYTILCGDKWTGVTVQELSMEKFDAGQLLLQKRVPIEPNATTPAIVNELSAMGASLLLDCLRDFDNCRRNATSQDESQVTQAPKLNSNIALIEDWNDVKWHAGYILQLHRAVYLLDLQEGPYCAELRPGRAQWQGDNLVIGCRDLSCIVVKRLKIAGKKEISGFDFKNGYMVGDASLIFGKQSDKNV